jgi:hypothetical protein
MRNNTHERSPEHHKFLGEDGIDTDLPSKLELICLKNVAGKAFFASVCLPASPVCMFAR